ncbi:ABC transporter substrate-binding protein [Tessaracoccus defluvii]|uniref:ABC transporter substrate-binding protein n=1 Tax=Tessaracoccus defluvii TaxID=1285901 RepID=A0A7H0H357_9ACTN|nr:ABC transporter substrate-binding protein [Tessaracoccus defluvii]QNP54973.1 ABC transporter substrate-binding protein [Tessaracoccus defluvii]
MRMLRSTIAVSAALMLGLTACSTSTPGGTPAPSETKPATSAPAESTPPAESTLPADGEIPKGDGTQTIYLVSKGFQHRFWQAVKEGAEQAGAEYGYKVEFVGPPSEKDVTIQLDQLETALATKPAAIGLAALDTAAATDVLDRISAANIPLVAFDSGVDSDAPITTVQTDNYAAAQEAAKHMAELIGNKGTVGLVCHDVTSQTGKQRCDGFQDWMKDNAPDVKLLEPLVAGSVDEATNAAKSLINSTPDISGVYGTNEAAATGAVQASIEVNKAGLQVVGFDSGEIQMSAIRDGKQAGAITQSPVKMGYETVTAAIKAINGMELPKIIDSGFAWYDKSNIDDPEIAANLYE